MASRGIGFMTMDQFHTVVELAESLGITRQAVYLRINKGQIRTVSFGKNKYLIEHKEFVRWTNMYHPFMHYKSKGNN